MTLMLVNQSFLFTLVFPFLVSTYCQLNGWLRSIVFPQLIFNFAQHIGPSAAAERGQ